MIFHRLFQKEILFNSIYIFAYFKSIKYCNKNFFLKNFKFEVLKKHAKLWNF